MKLNVKAGCVLKSKGGDFHRVLKVSKNEHIQNPWSGQMGTQSRNEGRAKIAVWIFDGIFTNKRSFESVEQMYVGVCQAKYEPITAALKRVYRHCSKEFGEDVALLSQLIDDIEDNTWIDYDEEKILPLCEET